MVDRHYGTIESIGKWGLNTSWHTIPFSIFPPWFWWRVGAWGGLNQDQAYHGFLFSFALAGLLVAALVLVAARAAVPARTRAGFAVGVFWFAWPLLYHQFGSQSLTHFVPIHRLSRHLVVYAPGAVFATVAACAVLAPVVSGWRLAPARRAVEAAAFCCWFCTWRSTGKANGLPTARITASRARTRAFANGCRLTCRRSSQTPEISACSTSG